jgi:hypothetical protein
MDINDKLLGIQLTDGAISITDTAGNNCTIFELPMVAYEMFYKLWQIAIQATISADGEQQQFTEAWVFNDAFRENMLKALVTAGLDNANMFTPRQLEALLITYKDGVGLLFQLHGQFPKLVRTPVQPQKSKSWTSLIQRAMYAGKSLITQTWLKSGLCHAF